MVVKSSILCVLEVIEEVVIPIQVLVPTIVFKNNILKFIVPSLDKIFQYHNANLIKLEKGILNT